MSARKAINEIIDYLNLIEEHQGAVQRWQQAQDELLHVHSGQIAALSERLFAPVQTDLRGSDQQELVVIPAEDYFAEIEAYREAMLDLLQEDSRPPADEPCGCAFCNAREVLERYAPHAALADEGCRCDEIQTEGSRT